MANLDLRTQNTPAQTLTSGRGCLYCTRSRLTHKPEAPAKGSPSLALQACVSIPNASSITALTPASPPPQVIHNPLRELRTRHPRLRSVARELPRNVIRDVQFSAWPFLGHRLALRKRRLHGLVHKLRRLIPLQML